MTVLDFLFDLNIRCCPFWSNFCFFVYCMRSSSSFWSADIVRSGISRVASKSLMGDVVGIVMLLFVTRGRVACNLIVSSLSFRFGVLFGAMFSTSWLKCIGTGWYFCVHDTKSLRVGINMSAVCFVLPKLKACLTRHWLCFWNTFVAAMRCSSVR